jgi:hypothetical protein
MKRFTLLLVFLAVLSIVSPALARVAAIQTSAPLADQSEASIKAAVKQAVEIAVRGAVAMGLPRVHLDDAVVLNDAVVIQILATDAEVDETDPDAGPQLGKPVPGAENPRGKLSL